MPRLSDLAQQATPGMLGSGLAQMAGEKLSLRKRYQDYVINANESGEEALPFNEWAATQANG